MPPTASSSILVALVILMGSLPGQTHHSGFLGAPVVFPFPTPSAQIPAVAPDRWLLADVTADGIPDLVSHPIPLTTSQLMTHVGLAGGGFGPPIAGPLFEIFQFVGMPFDYTGDGHVDIVGHGTTVSGSSWVCLLSGNSTGQFVVDSCLSFASPEIELETDDLDQDGIPELIVLRRPTAASTEISVHEYTPATWTTNSTDIIPGLHKLEGVGDFDGDLIRDIVLGAMDALGVATGTWVMRGQPPTGGHPVLLPQGPMALGFHEQTVVADMNRDGRDDLVGYTIVPGTSSSLATMTIALGDPQAIFLPETSLIPTYPAGSCFIPNGNYGHLSVANLNADGFPDLHLWLGYNSTTPCSTWAPNLSIFLANSGQGVHYLDHEQLPYPIGTRLGPHWFQDLDQDGDDDLIALSLPFFQPSSTAELTVLSNNAIRGPGVPAVSQTNPPGFDVGLARPGNQSFFMRLKGAAPSATAVFGVALESTPNLFTAQGGGFWLNTAPTSLISPTGNYGVFATDGTGELTISIPLPANMPHGAGVYAQFVVLDPSGIFTSLGNTPVTMTDARYIAIW